jgi:hypothetical protein
MSAPIPPSKPSFITKLQESIFGTEEQRRIRKEKGEAVKRKVLGLNEEGATLPALSNNAKYGFQSNRKATRRRKTRKSLRKRH